MKGRLTTIAICILMALTGPAMAWDGADSTPEPNTAFDQENEYMFKGAAGDSDNQKIYFDAFMMSSTYPVAGAVTNTPAETRMMPANWYQNYAILGFWVDCNDDGYIGNALTGQVAYSVNLLSSADKCPVGSSYNDGFIVDEFRAIYRGGPFEEGEDPRDPDFDLVQEGDGLAPYDVTVDPNDIFDPDARIWGDWSTPDKDAVPSQGIVPLPPGTLSTWHGHFKYVDDATLGDLSETLGANGVDYYGIAATMPDLYPGSNGDSPVSYVRYTYNDTDTARGGQRDCGGVNQPECEGAYAKPYVMAFDCKNADQGYYAPTVEVGDEGPAVNETGLYVAAPLEPTDVNPDGSVDGTLYQNTRAMGGPLFWADDGECSENGDHLPYGTLETASQDSNVNAEKMDADFNYFPVAEDRLRFASGNGLPDNVPFPLNGYCGMVDCSSYVGTGIGIGADLGMASGGYWADNTIYSRRPPRALWGLTQTIEVTNYADVGSGTADAAGVSLATALPSGDGAGTYGGEQCDDFNAQEVSHTGTWSCDPKEWDLDDSQDWWGIVGDAYDLRDEDCYDGSAFGTGVMPTDRLCALN